MHEAGVQEEISHQLIQMEIIGQEEVKAADIGQVDSSQLEDLSIYDLQIDYLRFGLTACFARKITKNICFSCRKELEYNYFSIKK